MGRLFCDYVIWNDGPSVDKLAEWFNARLIPFRLSKDGAPYAKYGREWHRVTCEQLSESDASRHRYRICLICNG